MEVYVLDAAGAIIGGLVGRTVWDWLEISVVWVEERRRPADAVVTVGTAALPFDWLHHAGWTETNDPHEIRRIAAGADRTWLVYTLPLHLESVYPEVMDVIRSDFRVEREFFGTLGDGTIYVCRADRRPDAP